MSSRIRSHLQSIALAATMVATSSAALAGVGGAGSTVNINTSTRTVNQVETNEVLEDIVLESLWRIVGHTERHTPQGKPIPPKHWDLEMVVSEAEFAAAVADLHSQLYALSSVPGQRTNYRSLYEVQQDEQTSSQQQLISQTFEQTVAGSEESYSESFDANGAQFGVDYIGDPDDYFTWIAIGGSDVNVDVEAITTTTTFVDQVTTNSWSQVAVWQISSTFTVTPLLLDLDGDGAIQASGGQWKPHRASAKGKMAFYDFYGNGFPVLMEWPGPQDGILCEPPPDGGALDGTRLFGSATGFKDGYEALSVKDTNGDLTIDGAELAGLAVWLDDNGDARPQKGEVRSVGEHRITSLSLRHQDLVASFTQGGAKKKMFDWWPQVYELNRVRVAPKNT